MEIVLFLKFHDLRGCKFKSKFRDNACIMSNVQKWFCFIKGLYVNASSGKYGFGVVKVWLKICGADDQQWEGFSKKIQVYIFLYIPYSRVLIVSVYGLL